MIDCLKVCPEWIRRYTAGETPKQIAAGSAFSAQGVILHLARHGALSHRAARSGHECDERCEAIRQGYAGGDSLETIGLRHRITKERVRQILRRHLVPIRLPSSRGGSSKSVHVCDRICEALIAAAAETGRAKFSAIEEEFGVAMSAIRSRAIRHRIKASMGRGHHNCGDLCRALIAYLTEHPDATTYSAAAQLGIHPGWVGMRFKANHPEHNRTRKYFTEQGRRIAAPLAAEPRA